MPNYAYECGECGNIILENMTYEEYDQNRDKIICKKCGNKMVRSYKPTAVIYKTTGFYANDSLIDDPQMDKMMGIKKSGGKLDSENSVY